MSILSAPVGDPPYNTNIHDVMLIQMLLKRSSITGEKFKKISIDGAWGKNTRIAVLEFKKILRPVDNNKNEKVKINSNLKNKNKENVSSRSAGDEKVVIYPNDEVINALCAHCVPPNHGIGGEATRDVKGGLIEEDYNYIGRELGIQDRYMVKALVRLESKDAPFDDNGQAPLLFERHWFYRLIAGTDKLKYQYNYLPIPRDQPEKAEEYSLVEKYICNKIPALYPEWKRDENGSKILDGRGEGIVLRTHNEYALPDKDQRKRLAMAVNIEEKAKKIREKNTKEMKKMSDIGAHQKQKNEWAAKMSTSWGAFQIMGFNFADCGFKSVDEFVDKMESSTKGQIDVFIAFCKVKDKQSRGKFIHALNNNGWEIIATYYNGPDAIKNNYHKKLEKFYMELKVTAEMEGYLKHKNIAKGTVMLPF